MSEVDDVAQPINEGESAREHDQQRGERQGICDQQRYHGGGLSSCLPRPLFTAVSRTFSRDGLSSRRRDRSTGGSVVSATLIMGVPSCLPGGFAGSSLAWGSPSAGGLQCTSELYTT